MGQTGGVGVRVGTCALPRGNMGHGAWLPAVSGEPELSSLSFINFSHQVSPYSMDDTDPQKFFMSGERKWVVKGMGRPQDVLTQHLPHPQASRAACPVLASSGFTGYVPRARFLFGSSFPVLTNQALQEFGQTCSRGRAQKDPKPLPTASQPQLSESGSSASLERLRGR